MLHSEQPKAMTKEASGITVHCAHDEMADVTSLIPNPRNPNKHGDKQVAMVAKIIRHQGWRAPIVVSKRSGFIVAGHGRLEAAKLLGVQSVPVNRQDFATEADEWAHLIADNRIAELAEMDSAALKDLLLELDTGAFDMDVTGFDADELDRVVNFYAAEKADEQAKLDRALQLNPTDEYIVIRCRSEDEWESVKEKFNLQPVRRGGYKSGSAFDSVGTQRVIEAAQILE